MSLSEAVLEIAQQMELELEGRDELHVAIVKGFARQIRSAVKASQSVAQVRAEHTRGWEDHQRSEVQRIKEKLDARVRDSANLEEASRQVVDGRGAICVGGKEDGTIAPVDPKMPVGAFVSLGDEVYQYREGKLFYHEEMTKKVQEKARSKILTQ